MKLYSVWLIVLTMLMGTASAASINFNGGAVAACPLTGSTYNCNSSFSMGGTDFVVIAGGYTVVMPSFSPSYNQGLTIASTGALQTTGNLSLSNNPANISIGGATLTAGGSVSLGSSMTINGSIVAASISTSNAVTVTGSVSVTGQADLGSAIKINGNLSGATITTTSPTTLNGSVTASVAFTLASGSSVTGNITAPKVTLSDAGSTIKGNINTTGALYIGSSNTVTGTVNAGSLSMHAENATINGATTVSGDVDMGSRTTINGDLTARNVTTHAENSLINGNAAVNAIYLDWRASVTKTITCTGPGAVGCSCVTKADSSYMPTCGAPPASAPHHFQINHSGSALTCQAQTVTVTACADASCATKYTSNVNVTLQPGGQTFAVSGGTNSVATVRSTTAGIQTLSASASGVTNDTICVNSGTGKPCEMEFKAAGLTVTGTNHVSMASGAVVTIEALKDDPAKSSCVPLVYGAANIDMACSYKNPASGSKTVGFDAKIASCGANNPGATVSVPVTFDASGKATVALQYADVGKVGVSASYLKNGVNYTGNGEFIAAPHRFVLTATNAGGTSFGPEPVTTMPSGLFAKANENFSLTITAVNKANNPVPNFGKESPASQVQVTPTVNKWNDSPLPMPVPKDAGSAGSIAAVSPTFNLGTGTSTTNFDNVGYVKLTATLKDASTPAYYMGVQISEFATTGWQYVARFVPDHFETELVANTGTTPPANLRTMDCPSPTSSIYPCSGNASFTHSAQSFYIRVKAYNGAATPALTTNYAGALAQPIALQAVTLADHTKEDKNGLISWSKETPMPVPSPTRFTFAGGVGELDMSGNSGANLPAYSFTAPHVPVTVYLRATDTVDNVTSLRTPASASKEALLTMVSGRLLLAKAFGSPTAPLSVGVTAQYLMPAGYVYNSLVNDISVDEVSKHIAFSNCLKAMATRTCTLTAANAKLELTKGIGKFKLAAPMPTLTSIGMIDVQLRDNQVTPVTELFPYLPSTTGTAIFGIYPSGPVIYTREIY